MRALFLAILVSLSAVSASAANPTTVTITIESAQQVAESNARRGVLAHCGRHRGRLEGIGFSPVSEQQAIANCCYWRSGRKVREIGVARGARGWYAVVWYD
jgi:hypothetical protein